jgi:hypothetical protein
MKISSVSPVSMMNRGAVAACAGATAAGLRAIFFLCIVRFDFSCVFALLTFQKNDGGRRCASFANASVCASGARKFCHLCCVCTWRTADCERKHGHDGTFLGCDER